MKLKDFIKNRIQVELPKSIGQDICGVCGENLECFDVLKGTLPKRA